MGTENVQFFHGLVIGFDDKKKKFKVRFDFGNRLVPRIYLCFDHENHYKWLDRFTVAWYRRIMVFFLFYIQKGLLINEERKLSTEHAKRTSIRFVSRLKEKDRRFDQKK